MADADPWAIAPKAQRSSRTVTLQHRRDAHLCCKQCGQRPASIGLGSILDRRLAVSAEAESTFPVVSEDQSRVMQVREGVCIECFRERGGM